MLYILSLKNILNSICEFAFLWRLLLLSFIGISNNLNRFNVFIRTVNISLFVLFNIQTNNEHCVIQQMENREFGIGEKYT